MSEPEGSDAAVIDTDLIRRLADILKDTDLSEIEVEKQDLRIRVARETVVQHAAPVAYAPAPMAAAPPPPATAAAAPAAATPAAAPAPAGAAMDGEAVKSPMVGTVYLQATPGAAPFARVGDQVSEGQTLLIIEAMKTMNPIPAPKSGVLKALLVADAQPVEFGEPLAVIG